MLHTTVKSPQNFPAITHHFPTHHLTSLHTTHLSYTPPGIFPYPPPGYPQEPPPESLHSIQIARISPLSHPKSPVRDLIKAYSAYIISILIHYMIYFRESQKRKGAITHHHSVDVSTTPWLSSFAAQASPQNRLKRGKDLEASLQTVCRISPEKMQRNCHFPAFWYIDFQICICYNGRRQKREYVHEDKKRVKPPVPLILGASSCSGSWE